MGRDGERRENEVKKARNQSIRRDCSGSNISGVDSQSSYAYERSLKRGLKYQCRTKEEQKFNSISTSQANLDPDSSTYKGAIEQEQSPVKLKLAA